MIEVAVDGAVWTLTMNRPDKANALTREMLGDLAEAVHQAQGADAAALVLTGRGKVFSAGADLDEARAGLTTDPVWEELSSGIASFPGITVAALNGTVAGGAMGMVLACDFRAAVPSAKFFYPVMKFGFLPQPTDPVRLRDLVGDSRAKRILLASERIDAATALDWGLVDEVAPPETMSKVVDAWCDVAAVAKPEILRHIKAAFLR